MEKDKVTAMPTTAPKTISCTTFPFTAPNLKIKGSVRIGSKPAQTAMLTAKPPSSAQEKQSRITQAIP